MIETLVNAFLLSLAVYSMIGFIFYVLFLVRGIKKVDAGTKDSSLGFKLIILPGVVILWPYLFKKWLSSN